MLFFILFSFVNVCFVCLLTGLFVNLVNQDCFAILLANINWPDSDYIKATDIFLQ